MPILGAVRSSFRRAGAVLALVLTGAAGWPGAPGAAAGRRTPCVSSVPFASGAGGYHTFRIPAVVRTRRGAVLAFAEGRRNSDADTGDIDIVLRRSADGGCTWGPLRVVTGAGHDTAGNPAPVADPVTGGVLLLSVRAPAAAVGGAPRRIRVQRSADAGVTWSAPRDITAAATLPSWDASATGPGHGLALRHGRHAGRLLVPAHHSSGSGAALRAGAHALYSDDHGATWHIGYTADPADPAVRPNESTFAELPDGTVYANTRNHRGTSPFARADAYLVRGGGAIAGAFRPQPQLAGPQVEGSTLLVDGVPGHPPVLVFSGPAHPAARAVMTLRLSRDGGRTWTPGPVVTRGPAGYSDLVRLDRDTVGLLYETGARGYHDTLTFTRIPVSRLQA